MDAAQLAILKSSIKTIPDYPKAGIQFRDITSLIQNNQAYNIAVKALSEPFRQANITKVVGAEARGFIFGAAVAAELNVGFVPARKPNKLPRETVSCSYQLEYGEDELHIHTDALTAEDNVLLVDDLIATGGTIAATVELVHSLGAQVEGAAFVIALPELGGVSKLAELDIRCVNLVEFDGE